MDCRSPPGLRQQQKHSWSPHHQLDLGHITQKRRRVEPLELALREGQLACAAVLIEGGARISERALKAVKLEPAGAVDPDRRCGGRIHQSCAEFSVGSVCAAMVCTSHPRLFSRG